MFCPQILEPRCVSYYPSKLPWVTSQAANSLELLLTAADSSGMEVHIGLVQSAQFYSIAGQTTAALGRLATRSAQVSARIWIRE